MAENYPVPPPPPPPEPQTGAAAAAARGNRAAPAPVPPAPLRRPPDGETLRCRQRRTGLDAPARRNARDARHAESAGPSPMEQRIQEMEKRFQEQETAKLSLGSQLGEIGKQLKEEHEKVILQSLKAKEEEALSARVEQQIREMQEKLRRDKHEQEFLESRSKAENQLKDLERRLAEERESWMAALKNQLKERELIEQDVEQNLSRKLREMEQRYQDEKIQWMTSVRQKDEEMSQVRAAASAGNRTPARNQSRKKTSGWRRCGKRRPNSAAPWNAKPRPNCGRCRRQLDNQMRDNGT